MQLHNVILYQVIISLTAQVSLSRVLFKESLKEMKDGQVTSSKHCSDAKEKSLPDW